MRVAQAVIHRGARLSACGLFRYELTRRWVDDGTELVFVMLNPSTAGEMLDDPTIRKCYGFAERLGFGGIRVVNLYAFRATKPADLKRAGYPVGPENDAYFQRAMLQALDGSGTVVCAWGANARGLYRPSELVSRARSLDVPLYALRLLADGTPEHPLMLPYSCTLQPYARKAIA